MDPLQVGTEKNSFGPFIGIVVIIVVLIIGAFYIWGGKLSDNGASEPAPLTATDEVSDIQADLGGGSDLNIDLSDIEADLQ
jgi:hypothetical protein